MKSRCQKGFQRLSEKKNLRKTALLSLTLPELLQPPSKHDIHVLSLCFNLGARSLGAPARPEQGTSSQQQGISWSSTGSKEPALLRGNGRPDVKGNPSQIKCEAQPSLGDSTGHVWAPGSPSSAHPHPAGTLGARAGARTLPRRAKCRILSRCGTAALPGFQGVASLHC